MTRGRAVLAFMLIACGLAAAALISQIHPRSHGDQGLSTPIPPGKLTQPDP